ncbi:MAG: hypothetical protein DHS20C11_15060 [Lysobacteraceae bacterium]|nr:MAG: hypothetical protein DHS20C11_15060 [Xanthomonadaceae bacterium]
MTGSRDHLELTYHSINVFSNDGKLDEYELDRLLDIAKKDGKVDENETRVLSNILSKLKSFELTYAMKKKIKEVEDKYGVDILGGT